MLLCDSLSRDVTTLMIAGPRKKKPRSVGEVSKYTNRNSMVKNTIFDGKPEPLRISAS